MPGIAFCPCPPVLVPEVAQGAGHELAGLLAACDRVVREAVAGAEAVVVVGAGRAPSVHPADAAGSFGGYGVPLRVGGAGTAALPLSLTVGAWLLDRAADASIPARTYVEVGPDGAAPPQPWLQAADAVLVMGDGSARLSERAPGGLDPDAPDYDAGVLAALASGDPARLVALDLVEGSRQMAAGAPAWRAVGSALLTAGDRGERTGRPYTARVVAHQASYGVSYLVASWS